MAKVERAHVLKSSRVLPPPSSSQGLSLVVIIMPLVSHPITENKKNADDY
jgi:hypothetical protein